jgi:5-methylcytosine-specific restriction endonuclease McrA
MDTNFFSDQHIANSKKYSQEAKEIIKKSYKTSRVHLDRAYEDFRNSEDGEKWVNEQLIRCQYKCPECLYPLTNENVTIDHKQPRKLAHWLAFKTENLWLLCHNCNWLKGSKSWEEYLDNIKDRLGESAVKRIQDLS